MVQWMRWGIPLNQNVRGMPKSVRLISQPQSEPLSLNSDARCQVVRLIIVGTMVVRVVSVLGSVLPPWIVVIRPTVVVVPVPRKILPLPVMLSIAVRVIGPGRGRLCQKCPRAQRQQCQQDVLHLSSFRMVVPENGARLLSVRMWNPVRISCVRLETLEFGVRTR